MQPGWLHLELNESTLDTDFCVTVLGPPAIVFLADGGPLGTTSQINNIYLGIYMGHIIEGL